MKYSERKLKMSDKSNKSQTDENKNSRLGTAGGQALIEGIMMNGPLGGAMAVRKTDGTIKTVKKEFKHIRDKVPVFKLPILRGIVNFIESMVFGYKCLMDSAEMSGQLEIEEEENMSKLDQWLSDHFGPKMMAVISTVAMVLGTVLAFVLFVYLPAFVIRLFDQYVLDGILNQYALRPLFEGIIRIAVFIAYIAAVSQMKDIKRVFMYHGAEHKTIFCYEAGEELTVENVKKYKRFHPRCGTSFIFIVLIISILASSVLAVVLKQFPGFTIGGTHILNVTWAWSLIKILIMPLVMGIGYEYIRFAGKHDNKCTRFFSAPGLWMQRLTTKEPDDSMIEVGIAALTAVTDKNWRQEEDADNQESDKNDAPENKD